MSDGWASPSGDPHRERHEGPPTPQGGPPPYQGDRPPPRYGAYGPVAPQGPPLAGPPGPPSPPGPPPAYPGGPQQFRPMAAKPGVIPLRPLALGDIFGGAVATVRGNPAATLGLSLIVNVIVAIPGLLVALWLKGEVFPDGFDFSESETGGGSPDLLKFDLITPVAQIFSTIGSIVLAGMLIIVIADAVLGRRISMGETWSRLRPRLWPLLGLTGLLLLAALLAVGVVAGVVALAAVTAGAVLAVVLGVLLGLALVVGFIFVAVRTSLASPALVLEGCGPIAALRRSWGLSRGSFWRLFGMRLLAQLAVGVIAGVVALPGTLLQVGGYGTDGLTSMLLLLFGQLWAAAVQAAVAPFTTGVTGLLYIDQRMRREGLDVALMSAAADTHDAAR